MRALPSSARIYLMAMCIAGLATTIWLTALQIPGSQATVSEMLLFTALSIVLGGKNVSILKDLLSEEAGNINLGFAVTFAALIRLGPSYAVVVGVLTCLCGCLYPRRLQAYQLCFNIALVAFETAVGGFVFLIVNHWSMQLQLLPTFMGILGAILFIYTIDTFGVSIMVGLTTENRTFDFWKRTFLCTAPSYFAAAILGALAILLLKENTGVMLLFITPLTYLSYISFKGYKARAEEKQQHFEALQVNQDHLAELYLATIKSLALAIDAKDQYTHQHILRVQTYSVAIAKQMGLEGIELEAVNTGALLHDIGKLGVPEYVLLKPGRLTDDEFDKIKKHPEIGAAILDPVEFPWPVLPVVRHHHEKFDGTGYPDGLAGEDIPLTARIMAVADVYDALTSTRSYRKGWSHEKAKESIINDAGTHFDPLVVEAFKVIIDNVVAKMAFNGEGPLAPRAAPELSDKAGLAAREISRASSELWALYEVAQSLSTSLGVQETVNILAHKLEAIFPDASTSFLLKETDGSLHVIAAAGLNRDYMLGAYTFKAGTASVNVLEQMGSYIGEFDAEDLMLMTSEYEPWHNVQTSLIVPIIYQGEALGTINLYHQQNDAFSDHDKDLLEMIAERSALALYNGMLYERTKSHAIKDPLTDLFNIRHLTEQVDLRCHEHPPEGEMPNRFALLCLDIDSFKPINDNFGHQKGDEVLREVARLITEAVPSESVVCRYGGDEFLILLDGAERAHAVEVASRIERSVQSYDPNLVHYKLGNLRIDVSIGLACFPDDGKDCTSLISFADTNMYQEKTEHKLGVLAKNDRKTHAA